jgi:hypothetical protein
MRNACGTVLPPRCFLEAPDAFEKEGGRLANKVNLQAKVTFRATVP